MALYILDTSIVSLLERQHPRTTAKYHAHLSDSLTISVVTVEESIGGWIAQLRKARTKAQIVSTSRSLASAAAGLAKFIIQPLTIDIVDRFDRLVKQKLNIGSMDLKIAATALELGATVVTQNVRDFRRVPGLLWDDWTQ
jgi:tRNA(fMet)-specific endonuclease VapC